MNLYAYVGNDPVNLTDPTGACPFCIYGVDPGTYLDAGSFAVGATSAFNNFRSGNINAGIVDTGGALLDLAALAVPGVTVGGASLGIQAGRTVDLFGGARSQIDNAVNVDLVAEVGVRASTDALPFADSSIRTVVASGPQAPFLSEASRVLEPGGQLFINATKGNPYGKLPSANELSGLGFQVIQRDGPLASQFADQTFRRTNGALIPTDSVRTTILERF